MKHRSLRKLFASKDALLVLVFALLCMGLTQLKTGFGEKEAETLRDPARILSVDNREMRIIGITKTGTQTLRTKFLRGPCKGEEISVENYLMGKLELDEIYQAGEKLLVQYSEKNGRPDGGVARGHYRIHVELILFGLFALLLLLVSGWTGLKALLSFIFAGLMIWKILIPLFLKGHDPVLVALLVTIPLTASISFLVGGLTRKGLATFLGAFFGLLFTAGMAIIFTRLLHLHGAVRPYAETLLFSGYHHLKLTPIFIASVFIASSGAVMDLAMDIASAMEEIKEKKPDIHYWEHTISGLRIGRCVIGTMTTTLLLAYSSHYIFMFMLFAGKNIPIEQIFNLNYVSAELLNTLVGSFGLVTVAPFTALVAGFLYRFTKLNTTDP